MQPSTLFHNIQAATSPSPRSLTDNHPFASTSSVNSIIPTPSKGLIMEPKQSTLHSLMSPPDATPYESFAHTASQAMPSKMKFPGGLPLSPPVSPATQTITTEERPVRAVADPILYPSTEPRSASSSQTPLFADDDAYRLVEEHMAARDSSLFREASPPREEEYLVVLEFKSTVMSQFNANRGKWLARERALLLADRERLSGPRRYTNIAPASGIKRHPASQGRTPSGAKSGGIVKHIRTPKPPRASPDPNKIRVGPREDRDFESLVDYCPPTSSLPSKTNSLKIDWRGAPIDLKEDKHLHLLHPDEVLLAANLRLDCATYLTSKRRIFVRRLECLKIGKEFRKTDAQQACKIDVNKASKLWSAFEKVGWLNKKWVEQYA